MVTRRPKMRDTRKLSSADNTSFVTSTFATSIGRRYQELVPMADLVSPNKTADLKSYEGWAYCARTPDREIFLAYFERGCPKSEIRGAKLNTKYRAEWFDPRTGAWQPAGPVRHPCQA